MHDDDRRRTYALRGKTAVSKGGGTAAVDGREPRSAGERLAAMRAAAPAIHQIATPATLPFQASVLQAAGAHPIGILTREEVTEVTAVTAGLSLAIGVLTPALLDTMLWAAETARGAGQPWVLDAAEVGVTIYRRQPTAALLARRPAAIAGDVEDILALAGIGAPGGPPEAAADAAASLAQRVGTVVAVEGAADDTDILLTDGTRASVIHGGDPLTTRITGHGAGRAALIAAFLATSPGTFEAAVAALALDAAAAGTAGARAAGPGSFAAAYLDALAAIAPGELDDVTRITPL